MVAEVKVLVDKTKEIQQALRLLASTRVLVGIPRDDEQKYGTGAVGSNVRDKVPGQEPMNNATLGYIHENGVPEVGIPARPFLEPGVASAQKQITQRLKDAGTAALDGRAGAVDKNFHAAGLVAQAAVRYKITVGPFEPLSPRTIAERRRRRPKSYGERPLIDTGQLRNSINYVVRYGVK